MGSLQDSAAKAMAKLPNSLANMMLPRVEMAPAGSDPKMRAGIEQGNGNSPIYVSDQASWNNPDDTPQLLGHEMYHDKVNNLPPKLMAHLPPDNPNDPYNYGGTEGLKKIGGDPLKLSNEQGAAAMQTMIAGRQNGEKLDPIYQTFDRKFGALPLSVMQPTDPNQKGINTLARNPGLPPGYAPGTGRILQAQNLIPVNPSGQMPWEKYAAQPAPAAEEGPWTKYGSASEPATAPAPDAPEQPLLQRMEQGASDFGKGAAKGLLNTEAGIGSMIHAIPGVGPALIPQAGLDTEKAYSQPSNTLQKVGKGVEQAAEFMVPGMGEDAAAVKAAEFAPRLAPLARMGVSALGSGAVNKAQGGGFGIGAAAGGIGAGIGEGLRAMAPGIAEGALNIRKLDRAYGRTPGKTILNETTGFSPGSIAESAQSRLNELNPQLNNAADAASFGDPVASMRPARNVLARAFDTADRQGERTTTGQLAPMASHLSETMSGEPIGEDVTPRQLLDLKRGFGNEFIHRWNPETMTGVKGTAGQAYHAMGSEFNRVVPGAAELNSRISNLIPVAKRGESAELNAPTGQRILNRFGAHTGALVTGALGAHEGYEKGGVSGAIGGGIAGVVLPEAIASPVGQIALARSLNGAAPVLTRAFTGGALQLNRPRK